MRAFASPAEYDLRGPNDDHIKHVITRFLDDEDAAARADFHEALGFEPLQRLADRGARYTKLFGEFSFFKSEIGIGRIHIHIEDRFAEHPVDVIRERKIVINGCESFHRVTDV